MLGLAAKMHWHFFCIEYRVDCERVTLVTYHFLDMRSQYGVESMKSNSKAKDVANFDTSLDFLSRSRGEMRSTRRYISGFTNGSFLYFPSPKKTSPPNLHHQRHLTDSPHLTQCPRMNLLPVFAGPVQQGDGVRKKQLTRYLTNISKHTPFHTPLTSATYSKHSSSDSIANI
jgi:hypothetical protein